MEVMKIKREKFYVYSDIFEAGLSAREIAVFAYLSRCANKDGVAFPSMRTIVDKCKMGYNTVLKCLEKLENIGFVYRKNCYVKSKSGRIRQTSNKYFIKKTLKFNLENNDESIEQVLPTEQGGASKQIGEVLPTEQGGASKQIEEINNKLNNINSPLSVSQYEGDGQTEILGLYFWGKGNYFFRQAAVLKKIYLSVHTDF